MDNILLVLALILIALVIGLAVYCFLWMKRLDMQEHTCPCCVEWEENE
jgi:multisubunit Na+/H+ antiporter MnhC subunit